MQPIKGSRVLITGGTGFIGSHLVRRLVLEQAEVFVLARKGASPWRFADVASKVTICEGDIAQEKDVVDCVKISQPDFIFNLAVMRKTDREVSMLAPSLDINLLGLLNLFKAAAKLNISPKAFVQTGSMEEYGNGPVPYKEEQREEPVSPYTASKVAATQFCQMLYRSLNYPVVVLRPCLIFGPYQEMDMFIPMLIDSCLKNKHFSMSSGEQTRDFAYVEDLVDAYLLAINCPKALGEVINIGTGGELKIKDMAKKIVEISKSNIQLKVGALPKRVSEIDRLVGDNSKAKVLLGWLPKTNLNKGLAQTIEWYRSVMK